MFYEALRPSSSAARYALRGVQSGGVQVPMDEAAEGGGPHAHDAAAARAHEDCDGLRDEKSLEWGRFCLPMVGRCVDW